VAFDCVKFVSVPFVLAIMPVALLDVAFDCVKFASVPFVLEIMTVALLEVAFECVEFASVPFVVAIRPVALLDVTFDASVTLPDVAFKWLVWFEVLFDLEDSLLLLVVIDDGDGDDALDEVLELFPGVVGAAGVGDGAGVGDNAFGDGDKAVDELVAFVLKRRANAVFSIHVFAAHLSDRQSAFLWQRMPTAHLDGQLPPQSTSVSISSLNLLAHLISALLNLVTMDLDSPMLTIVPEDVRSTPSAGISALGASGVLNFA